MSRAHLTRVRRVLIKIGSRTLASDTEIFSRLAGSVGWAKKKDIAVTIVSSGAIALGARKLGYAGRPKEMAKLQAAAAAGQSLLMRAYDEAFGAHGIAVAQVLLSHADLASRTRSNNAREALRALHEASAVPILNENDSVAVDEIRFSDNDQLASMVTPLVEAELVILLSDVEGLLDGKGSRISVVHDIESEARLHIRDTRGGVGTGGMASKVEAARRCGFSGANVVIADAREDGIVDAVLEGRDVGTLFVPPTKRLNAKKFWIAMTLRPHGDISLDAGAVARVTAKPSSILFVGIQGIRGDFRAGEAVRILDSFGKEIGRGLPRYASTDALKWAGKKTETLVPALPDAVFIHRDDLVIW